MSEKYHEQFRKGDLAVMTVGKKAHDALRKLKCNLVEDHSDLYHGLTFDRVSALADKLMQLYISKEYDIVEIIYNQFKKCCGSETYE